MNIARIPKRYRVQIERLTIKEHSYILVGLLRLSDGIDYDQSDNFAGDFLKQIWNDCVQMEKKSSGFDENLVGKLVAGLPAGTDSVGAGDSHTVVKCSVVKGSEVKGNSHTQKSKQQPPTLPEVIEYFGSNGYTTAAAEKAWEYYEANDWKDSRGNKVLSWKQKMLGVWFKPENKDPLSDVDFNKTYQTVSDCLEIFYCEDDAKRKAFRNKLSKKNHMLYMQTLTN